MHPIFKRPPNASVAPCRMTSLLHQNGQDTCLWPLFSIPPLAYRHCHQPPLTSAPVRTQYSRPSLLISFFVRTFPAKMSSFLPHSWTTRTSIFPPKPKSPFAPFHGCPPSNLDYPETSTEYNFCCLLYSSPSSSGVPYSTPTGKELLLPACLTIFITLNSSCTKPLSLQSQDSSCIGDKLTLFFAITKCRSILNKLNHSKGSAASANPDVILIGLARTHRIPCLPLEDDNLLQVVEPTSMWAAALSV